MGGGEYLKYSPISIRHCTRIDTTQTAEWKMAARAINMVSILDATRNRNQTELEERGLFGHCFNLVRASTLSPVLKMMIYLLVMVLEDALFK